MTDIKKYLIYTCIIIFAYYLFLMGFFPLKVTLPGFAKHENFTLGYEEKTFGYPEGNHGKLVLVLIDALRADFVFERKSMKFLNSLINNGKTHHYILRAHPPTVTLPRIKAITTGSIPGFVDVVLNFESQSLSEDNVITQAQRHGKKIVFYGDDTWIKLYPDHFSRSDGTTSFFVTDYTEVDNNVTRHLDAELSTLDWDLMLLHYLGLDHIGHMTGPSSPLVDPKLEEMDRIIERIYNVLKKKSPDSVMLVCGDHGMSDQGSHGGASDREVLVPAILLSPSFTSDRGTGLRWSRHRAPLQIDLAPTLAVLLGLPIPNNNLGQVLIEALQRYTGDQTLEVLHINSRQMLKLLQKNSQDFTKEPSYELYQRAVHLHENFLRRQGQEGTGLSTVLHGYETAMDAMATKISSSLTKYDLYSMVLGILLLLMMLVNEVWTMMSMRHSKKSTITVSSPIICGISLVTVFCHVTACTSQSFHSTSLCGTSPEAVVRQSVVFLSLQFLAGVFVCSCHASTICKKWIPTQLPSVLLVAGTVGHSLSLLSSSYVEEEHQTWNFLVMTFNLAVMATVFRQRIIKSLQEGKCGIVKTFAEFEQNELNDETKEDSLYLEQMKVKGEGQGDGQYHFLRERNVSDVSQNGYLTKLNTIQSGREMNKSLFDIPWHRLFPWQPVVSVFGVMLLGRCLRSINQTGNKWLDVPDIGDWLVRPENKAVLSVLVWLSLLAIFCLLASELSVETLLYAAGLYGSYSYRVATKSIYSIFNFGQDEAEAEITKGIAEASFVYCIIFAINIVSFLRYLLLKCSQKNIPLNEQICKLKIKIVSNLQSSFVILMTLLLRPHNTVLVAMVILQERLLWKHVLSVILPLPVSSIALFCWWMGQAVFFQQGNSNSLSTVDVAAGYVGVSVYDPALVLSLLYCSTYAGPVFWMLSLIRYILARGSHTRSKAAEVRAAGVSAVQALILERLFTLSLYCITVTTQRYHLFVWTVFSPKLLYEAWLTVTCAVFSFAIMLVI